AKKAPLAWFVTPVTLPPGWARLATSTGGASGSPPPLKTIGMVLVAVLAATVGARLVVTMISTPSWTNSTAKARAWSSLPPAHRHTKLMVWPSTYPSSWRARRKSGALQDGPGTLLVRSTPIRGSFLDGCASAVSDATRMPSTKSMRNVVVFIESPHLLGLPSCLFDTTDGIGV